MEVACSRYDAFNRRALLFTVACPEYRWPSLRCRMTVMDHGQSINHFIVLKKDMHCTTHDLQYVGWSQQNASEFQMYPL